MTDINKTNSLSTTTKSTASKSTNCKGDDNNQPSIQHHLDTQGLICPEPVMLLHRAIRKAEGGEVIEIIATDPATTRDIPNFCRHLGHMLVHQQKLDEAPTYRYLVKKKSS